MPAERKMKRKVIGLKLDRRAIRAYLVRVEKALKSPNRPVAVGYIRVSSRKQADEGGSLAAQHEAIIREAVLSGFDLAGVYPDEGISGGKGLDARPGLAAAIREVEEGRAQAIIVAYSDRLARDMDLAGYLRVRVKQAGGRVIAIGEAKDDPLRLLVERLLAELERFRGSQRMKFFHATRKAKGLRAGPPPFGFRTGADGRLEPEPAETPTVERILRLRADGASLRGIADHLNSAGVLGRSLRTWNAMTVSAVIKREFERRQTALVALLVESGRGRDDAENLVYQNLDADFRANHLRASIQQGPALLRERLAAAVGAVAAIGGDGWQQLREDVSEA